MENAGGSFEELTMVRIEEDGIMGEGETLAGAKRVLRKAQRAEADRLSADQANRHKAYANAYETIGCALVHPAHVEKTDLVAIGIPGWESHVSTVDGREVYAPISGVYGFTIIGYTVKTLLEFVSGDAPFALLSPKSGGDSEWKVFGTFADVTVCVDAPAGILSLLEMRIYNEGRRERSA